MVKEKSCNLSNLQKDLPQEDTTYFTGISQNLMVGGLSQYTEEEHGDLKRRS